MYDILLTFVLLLVKLLKLRFKKNLYTRSLSLSEELQDICLCQSSETVFSSTYESDHEYMNQGFKKASIHAL